MEVLMLRKIMLVIVSIVLQAGAEVILYENTAAGPASGPRAEPGDRFAAQQFLTGGADNVSSVTLAVQRVGSPVGQFHVQIWDDSGSGTPGSLVGSVGSVDVTSLPTTPAFLTVVGGVSGLNPHTPYYVVVDLADVSIDAANSIRSGLLDSSEGTLGAAELLVTVGPSQDQWVKLSDVLPLPPGVDVVYLQMRVVAIPEPATFPLLAIGLLAAMQMNRRAR
jgi:hypothetical protein